ncbi:hypothetical protein GC105_09245 [Alkalibaculum sp. M08DMB]|uniref:Uncharacterized protein n=1 Tax=Alkalibaculum sporogenes TaxID=2655001 RepID=A0A6A7K9E2_9FIRM|nr:hypothetical protein [Alkalibaculum sporogenes]MPW25975.1 hypothetical protein [Alkalibaculum sporogenes]
MIIEKTYLALDKGSLDDQTKEVKQTANDLGAYLAKVLDRKAYMEVDPLVGAVMVAYETQGYIKGFKIATKIISEALNDTQSI